MSCMQASGRPTALRSGRPLPRRLAQRQEPSKETHAFINPAQWLAFDNYTWIPNYNLPG
jgi:hypothetical protein